MSATTTQTLTDRAMEVLRRVGNPFRNYFARNPDDEVCARYHVAELFQREREQLLQVVDLYRFTPSTHSELIPVLGNKGAGKTHLLHSIKHGDDGAWQLLVTPGTFQRDTDFLEYLLFQVIDTLLGGARQKSFRPLEFVGEQLVRQYLGQALSTLDSNERLELFPLPGLGRWARRLGLGSSQARERTQWLIDTLTRPGQPFPPGAVVRACQEAGIELEKALEILMEYIDKTENHDTSGLMRRAICQGFGRAVLMQDESDLASFLTYGFAELDFRVRPSRQDLVLALFQVLMGFCNNLHVPVVVAFDQLEDLLLARRADDGHRTAEAFFAGIVQTMHNLDGMCILVFAERGLWNRFVPSLDGYIQDRLNNPIHLPNHGTLSTLRLEAPSPELVQRIVEARIRPAVEELPDHQDLSPMFPFSAEQVDRIAKTEPTLRDMLQQFRHLFDRIVYGHTDVPEEPTNRMGSAVESDVVESLQDPAPRVNKVDVVESSSIPSKTAPALKVNTNAPASIEAVWDQEMRSARRKLEPNGALTGATRELQAGLAKFLEVCHEHGVKVGPWRMQHVVGEWSFGDHPTYGVITIAHWVCKDGQPWKVGIGHYLGRGSAKPRDLEIKLSSLEVDPPMIDHLILLRPDTDLAMSGRTKQLWQQAEQNGHHARIEPVSLESFATLYGFPRFIGTLSEALPDNQELPNLADLLQEKCERLLPQVCMPVQG